MDGCEYRSHIPTLFLLLCRGVCRTDNAIKNHWNSSMKRKIEKYLAHKQDVPESRVRLTEDGRYDFMGDLEGVLVAVRGKDGNRKSDRKPLPKKKKKTKMLKHARPHPMHGIPGYPHHPPMYMHPPHYMHGIPPPPGPPYHMPPPHMNTSRGIPGKENQHPPHHSMHYPNGPPPTAGPHPSSSALPSSSASSAPASAPGDVRRPFGVSKYDADDQYNQRAPPYSPGRNPYPIAPGPPPPHGSDPYYGYGGSTSTNGDGSGTEKNDKNVTNGTSSKQNSDNPIHIRPSKGGLMSSNESGPMRGQDGPMPSCQSTTTTTTTTTTRPDSAVGKASVPLKQPCSSVPPQSPNHRDLQSNPAPEGMTPISSLKAAFIGAPDGDQDIMFSPTSSQNLSKTLFGESDPPHTTLLADGGLQTPRPSTPLPVLRFRIGSAVKRHGRNSISTPTTRSTHPDDLDLRKVAISPIAQIPSGKRDRSFLLTSSAKRDRSVAEVSMCSDLPHHPLSVSFADDEASPSLGILRNDNHNDREDSDRRDDKPTMTKSRFNIFLEPPSLLESSASKPTPRNVTMDEDDTPGRELAAPSPFDPQIIGVQTPAHHESKEKSFWSRQFGFSPADTTFTPFKSPSGSLRTDDAFVTSILEATPGGAIRLEPSPSPKRRRTTPTLESATASAFAME